MTKLANFVITQEFYDEADLCVEKVKRYRLADENSLCEGKLLTRGELIRDIEDNGLIYAMVYTIAGKYQPGETVRIILVNGRKFLRIDDFELPRDYLGQDRH